ncbi:RICIN domain-containing protein [Chenggangzhangella methanolivorans]|uniref:RICIN domain-containing protein n=1 Tax=Chenggangzhangella methanolivorans TaxID=1437009 RepID=A0A9E6RAT4_9HYPH|nr:RICIN domain-containing protein [Chenggangzhangella methanolivorans]QZO01346.1 RICIN domain-containing protein [Chenggangzhangella methanolivorans]
MRVEILLAGAAALAAAFCPVAANAQAPTGLAVNRNSGMCMGVAGAAADAPVAQGACLDQTAQQWALQSAAGGYAIVNRASGLCLEVSGGSKKNGAGVVQATCSGKSKQIWATVADGDWHRLKASHSGKCLDVDGSSIDEGGALVQQACASAPSQDWTLSPPAAPSKWSAKIDLPIIPVAAATLRNGKILAWSAYDRFNYSSQDQGKTFTTLYDPDTGKASERLVSNTGHDMFCPGTATLPDGRILVNGGSSSAKTSIYDPATNKWTQGAAMNVPRGYQGDTVLSNGDVLTVGGSWSGGVGGKIGEVWSVEGGWRTLPNIVAEKMAGPDPRGLFYGDNQMWLFGIAGGKVFHAGPGAEMFWLTTGGDGSMKSAGLRADDAYSQNGNVVYFDVGKLLKVGGAPAYTDAKAKEGAYLIDFSKGPSKPVKVTKQRPMAFPRSFANGVALPTGQVLIVGGQAYAKAFSDERSVMIPEIWTPETGEFRRLAPMSVPRNYHSVATLMRDGRVWVGGGGLCGEGCWANHADAEILTPPYLLDADGREAAGRRSPRRRPRARSAIRSR